MDLGASTDLLDALLALGQRPFNWAAPNGYPDSLGAWGPAPFTRWEFRSKLFGGEFEGPIFEPAAFLDLVGAPTQADFAAAVDARLTGGRSPAPPVTQLVYILLRGGLDGLSACVPHTDDAYYTARGTSPVSRPPRRGRRCGRPPSRRSCP